MTVRSRGPWVAALLLLTGCSSGHDKAPEAVSEKTATTAQSGSEAQTGYAESWAAFVANHPDVLQRILDENPENGWVKLYGRDYPAAEAAFSGATSDTGKLGLARSHLADAEFYSAAYALALDIDSRYLKLWEENASRLQKTDVFDFVAGMVALRSGDVARGLERLRAFRASPGARGSIGAIAAVLEGAALRANGDSAGAEKVWKTAAIAKDPAAAALLIGVRLEGAGAAPATFPAPTSAYGQRALLWSQVMAGNVDAAASIASGLDPKAPDHQEQVELPDGPVVRRYYDPLVLKALAGLHALQARQALGQMPGAATLLRAEANRILGRDGADVSGLPTRVAAESLPVFLFSDFPTPADLARFSSRVVGSKMVEEGLIASYARTLGPIPEVSAEGRDTRQAVVTAEAFLDAARKAVAGASSEEGRNTVLGLKVPDADISLAIRARAVEYESKGRLIEALFLLEHTVDKENTKISYLNDPLLYLEITRVYCALGRYREALNYFYRLAEVRPELWLIQESLGNLSVLGTVDHAGVNGQGG